jgi:tRNA pseudouridine32 synthase/23S rRNA pseudouridine746 synthase
MKHDPGGLPSETTWKVLGRAGGNTWLALEPLTGRTHQLRVHCAAMGWPIVGDNIYGKAPRVGGPGLHLHARDVAVPLYKNRPPIRVVAPVPAHMREPLAACGWSGDDEALSTAQGLSRPRAEEAAQRPSRSMGPPHPSRRGPADRSSG